MDTLPNKNGLGLDVNQLTIPCECMEHRKILILAWTKLIGCRITAVVSHPDGDEWIRNQGDVVGEPTIECDLCRNTGFRLSQQGADLAEWLQRYATDFLDEVIARRKKEETEDEAETDQLGSND